MLIGHLPAGYLMLRSLFRKHTAKAVLWAGLERFDFYLNQKDNAIPI